MPLRSLLLFGLLLICGTTVRGSTNKLSGINVKTDKKIEIGLKTPQKGTVIIFLSARCPCSGSHVSEIASLAKEFSSRGFQFVGVHSNEEETKSSDIAYFKALDFGFPIIEDHKFEIANRFGAVKTPHAFVISSDEKTLYRGGVSDRSDFSDAKEKYLRKALNQIVEGVPVDPSQTMSIGCAIRR